MRLPRERAPAQSAASREEAVAGTRALIIYRDQRCARSGREWLHHVQALLRHIERHPPPRRHEILHVLVDLSELAAAAADAQSPDRDRWSALDEQLTTGLLALARAADEVWTGDAVRSSALRQASHAVSAIDERALPHTLEQKTSEGFAYYALGPELYAEAATAWARDVEPSSVHCIGLRTIGLTLAAAAAARLQSAGVAVRVSSLRPRGHPFDRDVRIDTCLAARLTADANAWWLVVDEGPGLSGSSLAGAAAALRALGVSPERLVLMPAHAPTLHAYSAAVRRSWSRHRVCAVNFERTWIASGRLAAQCGSGELVDIAGGRWRAALSNSPWPAVHPGHERRKYAARHDAHNVYFVKWGGVGRYGATNEQRAAASADAGWRSAAGRWQEGWSVEPWVDEPWNTPQVTSTLVTQLADYLVFVSRTRATGQAVAIEGVHDMVAQNLDALGMRGQRLHVPAGTVTRPAVYVDARLRPHEWHLRDGRLQKTDGVEHGDDHFYPGPTDIAWDVAGIIEEWRLSAAAETALVERFVAATRDRELFVHLPYYRVAYLTWRAAYTAFAQSQLHGTDDERRFSAEHAQYRARLSVLLADTLSSRTGTPRDIAC